MQVVISMKKLCFALILLLGSSIIPSFGQPTRRGGMVWDSDEGRYVVNHTIVAEAGYQYFVAPPDPLGFGLATLHLSVDYAAMSVRTGIGFSKNTFQFSPMGIIGMVPTILKSMMKSSDNDVAFFTGLLMIGASQWPIPINDKLEITFGVDVLKLTLYNEDFMPPMGAVNAGLSFYFTDQLFANLYYEYNRLYTIANIHTCGAKLGWLF